MTNPDDHKRDDLKPPPLPQVTRLNRNILLVAAMGVAVTVLVVTHVVRSDRGVGPRGPGQARVEAGAVGSFLNDTTTALLIPPPAYPDSASSDSARVASTRSRAPVQSVTTPSQDPFASFELPPQPDPRELAYERALRAALRVRDNRWDGMQGALPEFDPPSIPPAYSDLQDPSADGTALREVVASTRPMAGALASGRHQEFLEAAGDLEATTYVRSRMMDPVSEYQVMAGTVLPAMLVTAMNSDMPGEIVAQVSRNVFDSQQRHLLIPRGTRVLGRYDNQVALGQSRVLIVWTRLLFPDGRSLSLPGLPTKDLRGASGVRSEVNNHYARRYGQAVLLSIIGAGAQLSQPQQANVLVPSSAGQVAAGALGQELSRISMETIRRNMDVRPTLEVEAGTPFYIFLERDLVLDEPYVDRRLGSELDRGGGIR